MEGSPCLGQEYSVIGSDADHHKQCPAQGDMRSPTTAGDGDGVNRKRSQRHQII